MFQSPLPQDGLHVYVWKCLLFRWCLYIYCLTYHTHAVTCHVYRPNLCYTVFCPLCRFWLLQSCDRIFIFAVATVVCDFVTVAPAVAILFQSVVVSRWWRRSSWACSGAVGSGSSFGQFWGEYRYGWLRLCEFHVCFPELQCEVSDCFDMFAIVVRSDCVAMARFAKTWLWSCVVSANMAEFSEFCVFDCP